MPAYAWWFVLALALAGGELLTSTFYLLVLGGAAAAGGLVALAGGPPVAQFVVAAVLGAAGALWLRRARARAAAAAGVDRIQHPDIGQSLRVDGWTASGTGKAQYRGAVWDVELAPGERPEPGEFLIRAIESNRLIVARRAR
jgi:membrane protein implicated in regulation of membrane protease activity